MSTLIIKQNCGIDASKDDFKACLIQYRQNLSLRIKATKTFKNTTDGFKQFLKWLKSKSTSALAMNCTIEATGVYHEELVHFLYAQNIPVSVLLPNKSKNYAKSLNLKSKTNSVDAKMLAQMGLERNLELWKPHISQMRNLKKMCRERVRLLQTKAKIKNRIHAEQHSFDTHESIITRLNKQLELIESQIVEIEREIKQLAKEDALLSQKVENIAKCKGLADLTILTITAETNGFELFTSCSQLVSYSGYDVVYNQSGTSINSKTKISKKGNKFIRRALYFPAITVVKYEDHFKNLYERVFERTKIKMKGYVAVQRKLLLLIYTLFKKDIAYDSDFYKPKQIENESISKSNNIEKLIATS